MKEFVTTLIKSQFLAALQTLRQGIDTCDEESWTADHIDTAVNQVVFHSLYFTDLYLNPSPDGFKDQQFHLDRPDFFQDYEEEEDRIPRNAYPRSGCIEYLDFCFQKAIDVIDSETESSLKGESGFSWLNFSRGELHIYNTRHIQHHAAQLGLRNQLRGNKAFRWIKQG